MTHRVSFDSAIYKLEAIKTACHRLSDRFSSLIETHGTEIVCLLEFEANRTDEIIAADINELKREVLDQDLRIKIKAETEATRNLILAHAFSKTGLIADEQVPINPVLRE